MGRYSYAKESLPNDWAAKIADDLKIEIKRYVLDSVMRGRKDEVIWERINELLDEFRDEFDDTELQIALGYREELSAFAEEAIAKVKTALGNIPPALFIAALSPKKNTNDQKRDEIAKYASLDIRFTSESAARVAERISSVTGGLQYSRATPNEVLYEEVHKAAKQFINEEWQSYKSAKQYLIRVNPRNIAEMNVRFQKYKDEKQALIDRGVMLVYVPPHANCSKRCQKWQNRVYSLDGTTGMIDGHRYIPIEDASENVTVQGKRDPSRRYYAGLFSYNCRHAMREYQRGQNFEKIPPREIERQREVETRQRQLERRIRTLKEKEQTYRTMYRVSPNADVLKVAQEARRKARELTREYEAYSRKNGAPIYRERIRIFEGEEIYKRTGKKPR